MVKLKQMVFIKNKKGEYYMDIQGKKEQLLKKLDMINGEIKSEDIKGASTEELMEYLKLNLEIQKKLEILELIENN